MEKRGERIFFPSFFLWEKPRGVCVESRGGYGAFFSKVLKSFASAQEDKK